MFQPKNKKIVIDNDKIGVSDWDAAEKMAGKNWQDIFRCKITIKDGILYTGDWLEVTADLENLYHDPLPVCFHLRITAPNGAEIDAFPDPIRNPQLRIALAPPIGNNSQWEQNFQWNRIITSHTFENGSFTTQITPIQIVQEFPRGRYTVRLMTYFIWPNNETGEPEFHEMSWDTKAFYIALKPKPFPPEPQPETYILPQLDRPIFHDHARLEASDLNILSSLPRASTALGLAIALAGQNGIIAGLSLGIGLDKHGKYVYINPGTGVINTTVEDISGVHPIILTRPLIVGYFADRIPSETRYDPIAISLSTMIEGIDPRSSGDDRIMIYPGSIDPDTGRPVRKVKNVPTRSKYIVKSQWLTGTNDLESAKKLEAPEGYMIIGWVTNTQNDQEKAVINRKFDPIIVSQHREAEVLDHPDKSVQARHIHPDVIGDFTPGSDLSLRKISDEIKLARGNRASIGERLEAIITEDGKIIEEPIIEMIDAQLTSLFSGIVDSKGNLMQNALLGSGLLSRAAATMGVAPHGQFVQLPHGFSQDQCVWSVGIAQMAFSPASGGEPADSITLQCYCQGRMVICQSIVEYAGGLNRTLPGAANFIAIAWESH